MGRQSLRYAVGVAAATAGFAQPASAFYFDGWPGAGGPTVVTLISPGGTSVSIGTEAIGHIEKPTGWVTSPPDVPEPLTLTLAACGLTAVGAWRWRKTTRPGGSAGG